MTILDYNVAFDQFVADSGAEPTLRQMVFLYYSRFFPEAMAAKYAREYCAMIEARLDGK